MEFTDLKEGQDYKVSSFKAYDKARTVHKNYECTRCQFSTLYDFKMAEHYEFQDKHNHHWAFPVGSEEAANAPKQAEGAAEPVPLKY